MDHHGCSGEIVVNPVGGVISLWAVPIGSSGGVRSGLRRGSGGQRVLRAVQVKELAAYRMARGSGLGSLRRRLLQQYIRLLRGQESLENREERGRRNPGLALIVQLDRERARLGRELHTGAGQAYSAIRYQLEWIEKKAPDLPEPIRECLQRIGKAARDADMEIRAVSQWLHPPDWQALGLLEALRNLWENSGIPETFEASLNLGPLTTEPPHPARVTAYRIVQEGPLMSYGIRGRPAWSYLSSRPGKNCGCDSRITDGDSTCARPPRRKVSACGRCATNCACSEAR